MLTRKLLALVLPEGLLLLLAVTLVFRGAGDPAAAPVVHLYPLVILTAGLIFGWRFQRGRLLFALCGLVIADRALIWLAPLDSDAAHAGPVVVRTVAILLTLSFAALAFVRECGAMTQTGLRRAAGLAALTAVLLATWLLTAAYPQGVTQLFDLVLLPAPILASLPLGQPATLIALVAIATLLARTVWHPGPDSRGFLWAAVACVIAASAAPGSTYVTLHLANAGLVLVVASVESVYAMAYHDELTGLPARRALNDALQRLGETYTVAMVDVDHFKQFNDTHGHDVGDQVLRMVAGRLARVAGGGRAFRYGGEEFAVLFPGKSASESAPHLEALREAVAGARFTQRAPGRPTVKPRSPRSRADSGKHLAVTVSIGAAQARGSSVPEQVVKAADKALYRAKEGGRNRVAL